jgi:hypothetical protein
MDVETKRQKLLATGADFVTVLGPKKASCGHRKWVGKTLSVPAGRRGKSLDDAIADGLFGEGCEHDVAVLMDFS